jgi:hypothetical protein
MSAQRPVAYPASGKSVVQTVPAARALAGVFTLVPLLAFAITVAFAHDWLKVIITSVLTAAVCAGLMIPALSMYSNWSVPPPHRIHPDQLPPAVGIWKANVPGIVVMPIVGAVAVTWSLSSHVYVVIGIFLGIPAMAWNDVRRAKHIEYEMHGTLWHTSGFAWTAKSRSRYLVAEAAAHS